ncbi:hypothetical protein GCM10023168_36530 [Fodinibacter luteus]|uniref:Uncharacterized protein n=2 Tax=Fodinibacter luteus TaxID=552064 RepID=A0ABP8KS68_9MICO
MASIDAKAPRRRTPDERTLDVPTDARVGGTGEGLAMEIWFWILGIVAVAAVIAMVVDRRRGPSNSGGSVDFNMNSRTDEEYRGDFHGPSSSGGGGGGG